MQSIKTAKEIYCYFPHLWCFFIPGKTTTFAPEPPNERTMHSRLLLAFLLMPFCALAQVGESTKDSLLNRLYNRAATLMGEGELEAAQACFDSAFAMPGAEKSPTRSARHSIFSAAISPIASWSRMRQVSAADGRKPGRSRERKKS